MVVVGEKEKINRTISVRRHKKGDQGAATIEEFTAMILENIKTKSLTT